MVVLLISAPVLVGFPLGLVYLKSGSGLGGGYPICYLRGETPIFQGSLTSSQA